MDMLPVPSRGELVGFARQVLRERGLSEEDAEDLVHDAYAEWYASAAVREAGVWLRGCVRNMARERARKHRGERPADALEVQHYSLDLQWARGGS